MSLDIVNANNISIANVSDYLLLKEAFDGSGGFKDGKYLTPHWREKPLRYQRRQYDCWYPMVLKPIITAHVEPIFKSKPERDFGKNDILTKFTEDADNKGNSLDVVMKRNVREARLQGLVYILVDNVENPETNREKIVKNRSMPYLVRITRDRVDDKTLKLDKFGNIEELTYSIIRFDENEKEIKESKTWTTTDWTLRDEKGEFIKGANHNLGVVPIITYSGVDSDDEAPQSDFFHVAKASHRLFNLISNIQEQEDNQMYAVMTLPKDGRGQKNLGTSNALTFDPQARKGPAYISPPVDPINVLTQNAANLIVYMYDMSSLAIIKSVSNTSGESKRWDYEKTETVLSGTALGAENAEKQIFAMVQRYMKLKVDVSIRYTRKFTFIDSEKEIEKAVELIAMNLGPEGNASIKKNSVENALHYLPNKEKQAINDSIDEQAKVDETEPIIDDGE